MMDDIVIPRHHYDALIGAALQVTVVANNLVETVLNGSPYEDMLRGPNEALKAGLANVPGVANWNGRWNDDDVSFETYRHEAQPRNMPDIGVKALHVPTGLSAESYMKHSVEANKDAARRGLKAIVERRAREMRP